MRLARDIWRVGVVAAPIADILRAGAIDGFPVTMLPVEGRMRFLADPFCLPRDGRLYVFAERYDYRDRHGVIDCLILGPDRAVLERRTVVDEPWHLSYPFVFEADGTTWMLPEAYRSGGLSLYRSVEFPWRWERAAEIALDVVPVDATPVFHDGLWWLFYTAARRHDLHLAWAERITGPWHPHAGNPVRTGAKGARCGGTPAIVDGRLVVPVQDCAATYGAAVRPLWIDRLSPTAFAAELGPALPIPAALAPFTLGMHTLSTAGDVTLFDVKRSELSPSSIATLALRGFRARAADRR